MDIGHDTMSHFKEILYIKESIANEEIEEKNFVREYKDVEVLESLEDESELGQVRKLVKEWKGEEDIRIIEKINLILEKGYELEEIERNKLRNVLIDNEVDIQELKRKLEDGELPLRVKEKTALKDKDDDEREKEIIIAEKWREKRHTRITIARIKRLLRHRDLLDDELKTKLDELDDEAETEKRLKGLKRINESFRKFIELFQENKNEKEENIKEILDEYLRKQKDRVKRKKRRKKNIWDV
ncbi:hypothetical protein C1645_822594 [Glomus cerebriforme]|uniref:Uncharacterized protein n=1 Tax=Glomus cerebriforme TaxID=658196 RepID=A0A397SXT9_9GLOM|nr:hypothetical protein C1645_822594 [Glomus cerebriforme]